MSRDLTVPEKSNPILTTNKRTILEPGTIPASVYQPPAPGPLLSMRSLLLLWVAASCFWGLGVTLWGEGDITGLELVGLCLLEGLLCSFLLIAGYSGVKSLQEGRRRYKLHQHLFQTLQTSAWADHVQLLLEHDGVRVRKLRYCQENPGASGPFQMQLMEELLDERLFRLDEETEALECLAEWKEEIRTQDPKSIPESSHSELKSMHQRLLEQLEKDS